jgi:hypothetical protein
MAILTHTQNLGLEQNHLHSKIGNWVLWVLSGMLTPSLPPMPPPTFASANHQALCTLKGTTVAITSKIQGFHSEQCLKMSSHHFQIEGLRCDLHIMTLQS